MATPRWLNRVVIDAIHLDQLREHGGLRGMRNEPVLTAALESPKKRWEEEDKPDLARLASSYGHDIATDRPYRDGNTRVAFLAMAAFLEMNGRTVTASEEEAHELVQRHLQRSLPGSAVVVLKRNNSENRLEAATALVPGAVGE